MKKVFSKLLIVLILIAMVLPMLAVVSKAAPPIEVPPEVPERSIQLIPFDLDTLASGDVEAITAELYPCGMHLPTMFTDFLDYIPLEGNIIQGTVAETLREEYPATNGYFTYAEYRAMERFVALQSIHSSGIVSAVSSAIDEIRPGQSWFYESTFPALADATRFSNAIKVYQNFLKAAVAAGGSNLTPLDGWDDITSKVQDRFYLTAGVSVSLSDIEAGGNPQLIIGITYSDYILQLSAMWDYFGFNLNLGAEPEVSGDGQPEVPVLDVTPAEEQELEGNPNNKYIYSDAQVPKKNVTIDTETGQILVDGKEVRVTVGESGEDTRSKTTVQSIAPPDELIYGAPLVKQYGWRDFITSVALLLVVCTVIIAWIVHTIRQYQDPLKRWKM